MALPAGWTSTSTPASGCSGLRLGLGVGPGRFAAHDRARAHLGLHEPQAAAAAREQVLDDFLEVARRRFEGLLEALPVWRSASRISPSSSARAVSRSLRCVSSLSTWATASSYSSAASGLTRRAARAGAGGARRAQGLALLLRQRLGGLRPRGPVAPPAAPARARPRRPRRAPAAPPPRRTTASLASAGEPELRLLVGAGAQLRAGLIAWRRRRPRARPPRRRGGPPPRRGPCPARRRHAGPRAGGLRRSRFRPGGPDRARASGARAGALGQAPPARRSAWTSARRTAPTLGLAQRLDQPCHPTGLLGGLIVPALGAGTSSRPRRARVGRPDGGRRARCHPRLGLLGGRPLGVRGELVAPTALREQPLGAAGRRLAELAARDVEHAAAPGDGDAVEVLGDRVQESTIHTSASRRSASLANSGSGRRARAAAAPGAGTCRPPVPGPSGPAPWRPSRPRRRAGAHRRGRPPRSRPRRGPSTAAARSHSRPRPRSRARAPARPRVPVRPRASARHRRGPRLPWPPGAGRPRARRHGAPIAPARTLPRPRSALACVPPRRRPARPAAALLAAAGSRGRRVAHSAGAHAATPVRRARPPARDGRRGRRDGRRLELFLQKRELVRCDARGARRRNAPGRAPARAGCRSARPPSERQTGGPGAAPQPRLRRERLLRRLAAPGDLGQQPLGLVALGAAVERASAALSSARAARTSSPASRSRASSDWRSIR